MDPFGRLRLRVVIAGLAMLVASSAIAIAFDGPGAGLYLAIVLDIFTLDLG